MRTVLLGERPAEVEELIARRHALGQDLYDEVWEGDYHMAPAPHGRHGHVDDEIAAILRPLAMAAGLRGSGPCNLGTPFDYRVPDRAYFADRTTRTFYPTAEIVIEIVSPDDESWNKLDFYFRAGVKEVGMVDALSGADATPPAAGNARQEASGGDGLGGPSTRSVGWFTRDETGFQAAEGSELLGISTVGLAKQIDWPR